MLEVLIGETIGNFKVLCLLGEGGMGEVYLGEQVAIHTSVAIKVLHRNISADTAHVQRFFNEARIVSRIKHSGIVKIFDVGFHGDRAYLVMEFLEGESLSRRIERGGPMPPAHVADFCAQVASALAATHEAGVIHRDLKPDNIFITTDLELRSRQRIRLLDFGIAKLSGTLVNGGTPQTVGTMGTPGYMAPEQWHDSAKVDWRADAYSLGCVAFELACGVPPFRALTIAEACSKHLNTPPPAPRSLRPDLPVALDQLIYRLLAKDPAARGGSMVEIAELFAGSAAGSTLTPVIAPPSLDHLDRSDRGPATTLGSSLGEISSSPSAPSRKRLAIAGLAAAAALAAVLLFALGGSTTPAPTPAPAIEPARAPSTTPATATPTVPPAAPKEPPPSTPPPAVVPAAAVPPPPPSPTTPPPTPAPTTPGHKTVPTVKKVTGKGSSSTKTPPSCDPPYTIDAATRKRTYKPECL